MSVFTTVELAELEQFLSRYRLGRICDFSPIAAGITNTNYALTTECGSYVLTLYEHHSDEELDYMLGLQQHLADRAVLCPAPVRDRRGDFYSVLKQRPAAINRCLPGKVAEKPGPEHCSRIGAELARFHLAGLDYAGIRPNPRGIEWLNAARDMLDDRLDPEDRHLIASTLQDYRQFDLDALPCGAIHADLFHDNALFEGDGLGGIIDFDYACQDSFALDIAVMLNDWCIDADGLLETERVTALLGAYSHRRPLQSYEMNALPLMLRFGAMRFWISRLYDRVFPLSGSMTFSKSPAEFRRLLVLRSERRQELEDYFSHMACGAK